MPASAASAPMKKHSWNADPVGTGFAPAPSSCVLLVSTRAMTAPATVVPTERMRLLSPTPAEASSSGTLRRIRVGIAA